VGGASSNVSPFLQGTRRNLDESPPFKWEWFSEPLDCSPNEGCSPEPMVGTMNPLEGNPRPSRAGRKSGSLPPTKNLLNPLSSLYLQVRKMTVVNNSLNKVHIKYHVKELEEKIIQEFINVLKNNVIDPYKTNVVLYGEDFVFVYVHAKRFEYTIRFKFEVYRRKEFKLSNHYNLSIGTVYVSVRI
jgi:hypothetical protein